MRREFKSILYKEIANNKDIWLISPDLGYKFLDKIREDFKDRVVIIGASEQAAVGITCGLALSGKIPIVYSITPFIVSQCHEFLKNYLNHDRIPVKILCGGRDGDYSDHDGFSHECYSDKYIMAGFPNIKAYWPEKIEDLEKTCKDWLYNGQPSYLNLKR